MFDWDWTDRDVILMSPYYGDRYPLIVTSLEYFNTKVDPSRWGMLVIDDGWGQDWSELEEKYPFVRFLQIRKTGSPIRDARFSRNVFLKRTKSKWVGFRDPECVIRGDFIQAILDTPATGYCRPMGIHSLCQSSTEQVTRGDALISDLKFRKNESNNTRDIQYSRVKIHRTFGCHWGYGVKTEHLVNVGGYDERVSNNSVWFKYFNGHPPQGEEFVVKYLQKSGIRPVWLPEIGTYHLWHGLKEPHLRHEYYRALGEKYKNVVAPVTPHRVVNVNADEGINWGEQYDKGMI